MASQGVVDEADDRLAGRAEEAVLAIGAAAFMRVVELLAGIAVVVSNIERTSRKLGDVSGSSTRRSQTPNPPAAASHIMMRWYSSQPISSMAISMISKGVVGSTCLLSLRRCFVSALVWGNVS